MSITSSSTPRPSAFTSRRQFMYLGVLTVGAAWLGTWLQSRLFPRTNRTTETVPVTFSLNELPVGGTKSVTYAGTSVLVLRTPESVRAFSLVCTHLGCIIQWKKENDEFYCPCHDGRYDQFGDVTAGPPTIPLEQFPVRIEGDAVVVGEV